MKQIITQVKSEGPEQIWEAAASLIESLPSKSGVVQVGVDELVRMYYLS
jgi:hypothetical protein